MAKQSRVCVKRGRGKGGKIVCKKYKTTTTSYAKSVRKYNRKVRAGLKSGRYQTKCTTHTQTHPKRFRDARCRDKATGKFVPGRFCKNTRCAR